MNNSPATITSLQGEATTRIRLAIKDPTGPASLNETTVKAFFQRYSHHVQACLDGVIEGSDVPALFWADQFIMSTSSGLKTGTNDKQLASEIDQVMKRYKEQGMKKVHLEDADVTILDANHAVAQVSWSLHTERNSRRRGDVSYEASYFLRQTGCEEMRIFGSIESKEKQHLRDAGCHSKGQRELISATKSVGNAQRRSEF